MGGPTPVLHDLGDAQLRKLMEDLQWEVAHRELNVSPGAHPWATGGFWQEIGTPVWMMRRSLSWEGGDGMGTQRTTTLTHWSPSTIRGCRMSYKYPSHQVATGYFENKHFQWQSHAGKDRSVFQIMVP